MTIDFVKYQMSNDDCKMSNVKCQMLMSGQVRSVDLVRSQQISEDLVRLCCIIIRVCRLGQRIDCVLMFSIFIMEMMMMMMKMMMMLFIPPSPFLASHCHLSTLPIGFLTTLQINQVSDSISGEKIFFSRKRGERWFLCQPTD